MQINRSFGIRLATLALGASICALASADFELRSLTYVPIGWGNVNVYATVQNTAWFNTVTGRLWGEVDLGPYPLYPSVTVSDMRPGETRMVMIGMLRARPGTWFSSGLINYYTVGKSGNSRFSVPPLQVRVF